MSTAAAAPRADPEGPAAAAARDSHKGPAWDLRHGDLRVSDNKRFLMHKDGTPFLWIGDTGWEIFHRSTREEAELYLEKRRSQGFTVIQTHGLSYLGEPNSYGHEPLLNQDPARPDTKPGPANDFWDHVDYVVDAAAKKGLYIAMAVAWGNRVGLFNEASARAYGRFVGSRYRDRANIVWIIGGDEQERLGDNPRKIAAPVWRAMAEAIKQADRGRHLMTFHPWRPDSSSRWFHRDTWLDFNMLQSGHGGRYGPNYDRIAGDYNLWPPKPCVDGEPAYENHPISHNKALGRFDEYDVRQGAYWAVFAGAFGHTYGSHDIWQMWAPGREPVTNARTPWKEALDQEGAWSMLHLRRLMLSRPFLTRIPDPSVVVSGQGTGADHVESTRDQDGRYAFVYVATGKPVRVDLRKITGPRVRAWWFDPRTGAAKQIEEVTPRGRSEIYRLYDPPAVSTVGHYPGPGNDWVLVLDDASKGYPAPGTCAGACPSR